MEVLQNLIDTLARFISDQPAPALEISVRDQKRGAVFFVWDNGIWTDLASPGTGSACCFTLSIKEDSYEV